jgi:NAD(P)-dependent dehydrogenase (short-subunit alcohol dehydrogenase family)
MKALAGRHVLVTGGGRGIGRAVARAFSAVGAAVTVTGRDAAALEEAVRAGDAAGREAFDVTDEAATLAGIAAAAGRLGPVDVLVANAGAAESGPFLRSDAALFRRMLDLNLMSVVHCARAVLPAMQERRQGRIIAIGSTAGLKGYAYVTAYTAAKHAVVGFVKALALETATAGITVNAVCPGYTETDLVSRAIVNIAEKTGRSRDAALADILKDKPLKRLIRPDEVAAMCLYLAGDGAAAVTGAALPVAGAEV